VVSVVRFDHAPLAVVLVRRGGYAVGLADATGVLTASKVGTRHVQSRTAAGGWSQQRFARRRGNQADELVRAVAEHAHRLVPRGIPAGVVLGGDRALVRAVLDDDRLEFLGTLPARELYDLPDPRRSVLEDAVRRGRAVRVTIEEQA
jgi:peptide subunit release factor 1 (eRF1)